MHRFGLRLDHLRSRLAPRPPAEPLPGTRMLQTRQGRIHVHEAGDGDTTVLLAPDPPCGLDHYAPLVARLARDHHVMAFELPGFGWSRPAPGFDWSLESTARLVDEIVTATTDRPVVPALACVAGLAGLHFAAHTAHPVAGYVSVQTPDWPEVSRWLGRIDPRGTVRRGVRGPLAVWAATGRIARGWYRYAEPDPARRAALLDQYRARPRAGRLFCLAAVGRSLLRDDPLPRGFEGPSAVVWGDADRSHHGYDPATLTGRLPGAALVRVPDGGHFPELSDLEALPRALGALRVP